MRSRKTYVFDNHNQERQLDAQGLLRVRGAGDVVGRHVRAHNFKNRGLDVGVREALDVAVSHAFVPNLERFGPLEAVRSRAEQRSNRAAGPVATCSETLTQSSRELRENRTGKCF